MLIAEELLLVAMHPDKGTLLRKPRDEVMLAVAGALIAELAFTGRADLSGKRILVPTPPTDPTLLAAVQQVLAGPGGSRASDQLSSVARKLDLWDSLIDALIARNVLGRRQDKLLLGHVTRHPVLDLAARNQVLERVWAALLGAGPIEPRTATIVALADECRVLKAIARPLVGRTQLKHRVREAAKAAPVTPIVHKAIDVARSSSA